MISGNENKGGSALSILVLTQDKWGERLASKTKHDAPKNWGVHTWNAAPVLPRRETKQSTQLMVPQGVEIIFPKPFRSLTESTYNRKPIRNFTTNTLIQDFAKSYSFEIEVVAKNNLQDAIKRRIQEPLKPTGDLRPHGRFDEFEIEKQGRM
jgi:hypothetical protein